MIKLLPLSMNKINHQVKKLEKKVSIKLAGGQCVEKVAGNF